jgi:Rrf2 family iron-sulfur cluster assembly transcriptional regulator
MFLTTKGRYAVMAMVDLTIHASERPQNLSLISKRQGIDVAYLEQIFAKLKAVSLVKAFKGPGGGYKLNRSPDEIKILEVMMAVDEQLKMTRCNSDNEVGCMESGARCITHHLWEKLEKQIMSFLGSVTLDDVCSNRLESSELYSCIPNIKVMGKLYGSK